MGKKYFNTMIIAIIFLLMQGNLYAYSPSVHRKITETVNYRNSSKYNAYLKKIGIPGGIYEEVDSKTIHKWIEDGSVSEDFNIQIMTSHFYDPLSNTGIGESAYDRAVNASNDWSWIAARKYFLFGLTMGTKNMRDVTLSHAFDALGHVMHLVQDMAVPAHARKDLHAPDLYEMYVKPPSIGYYLALNNFGLNPSEGPNVLRRYWDTDAYDGGVPLTDNSIGLAEYTNANYLSEDTIFKDYPHPSIDKTNIALIQQTASDGEEDTVWYAQGYTSERLVALSLIWKYDAESGNPLYKEWYYHLDRYVHDDYAKELVPRAVGYSSGIIDYFFRGDIDLEPAKDAQGNQIAGKYSIKNLSGENMNGTFTLYYDDKDGNRMPIAGANWQLYISSGTSEDPGISAPLTINWPASSNIAQFILVFEGTLGKETDAVAGKVIDDLPEYAFVIQEEVISPALPSEGCSDVYVKGNLGCGCNQHYSCEAAYNGCYEVRLWEDYTCQKGWNSSSRDYPNILTGRFLTYGVVQSIKATGDNI